MGMAHKRIREKRNSEVQGQHHPKAGAVVAILGKVDVATRRTANPGIDVPVTPAKNATPSGRRPLGILHEFLAIGSIPIMAPLENISMQVVQSKTVPLLLAYRMGS